MGKKSTRLFRGVFRRISFGATGHSLATCKQLEERSEAKLHAYRPSSDYDSVLFYIAEQSMIGRSYDYAKTNSESKTSAVAYLGIKANSEIIDKLRQSNRTSLSVEELNRKNPDIQIVYIDVLPDSSSS